MIQNISLYHVQLPLKFTFKTAKAMVNVRDTLIVRMETDTNYVGYGECVAFRDPFYTAETVDSSWYILQEMLSSLVGKKIDRTCYESWLQRGYPMAVSAVENVLLHIECEQMGCNTVEHVMGQSLDSTIPMGLVIGDIGIDDVLSQVEKAIELGCERIKLKVSPKDGYERTALVRKAFPSLTLAVDCNQSYGYDDIDLVRQYNDLQLACMEEPFHMESLATYRKFKETQGANWGIETPICLDESIITYKDLEYAIDHQLLDVLNVKVGRFGGLQETAKVIHACRKQKIPYWIGSMVESGISKLLHVQLAALGDGYMAGDLSDSSRYFQEELITNPITFHKGWTTVPRGKGLGVGVSLDTIRAHTVKEVHWSV